MNNRDIHKGCVEQNMRIPQIIHLGGAMVSVDPVPDILVDAFDDIIWSESLKEIFSTILPSHIEAEDVDVEDLLEWASEAGFFGFLVQVDIPYIETEDVRLDDEGKYEGHDYSWSTYTSKWVYGETMESVFLKASLWATNTNNYRIAKAVSEQP